MDGQDALIIASGDDALKKLSLKETTPISLKTLITDESECFDSPFLSSADIATATLASGCLPRRAEPETFSDSSISPTTVALQAITGSSSSGSLTANTSYNTVIATTSPTPSEGLQSQSVTIPVDCLSTQYISASSPLLSLSSLEKSLHIGGSVGGSGSTTTRTSCQPQTSPLPHIKEEEESEHLLVRQLHFTDSQPSNNCENLIANNFAASVIEEPGIVQQDNQSSTPSPRIKLKLRKHYKSAWSRIIFASNATAGGATNTSADSNVAIASAGNISTVNNNTNNNNCKNSGGTVTASQISTSHLHPTGKMQAEQGSIGDLQKYHSRYLKNRRHTLANVR